MKKDSCVFAGTFDPFTKGHEHVVETALKDFNKVIIGILVNVQKQPFFTLEQRLDFIRTIYYGRADVEVKSYSGMLVGFLKENGTVYTVRGIRNDSDLQYEKIMEKNNLSMMPETVTVMYKCHYSDKDISSTSIRALIKNGQDVSPYVNAAILPKINKIVSDFANKAD